MIVAYCGDPVMPNSGRGGGVIFFPFYFFSFSFFFFFCLFILLYWPFQGGASFLDPFVIYFSCLSLLRFLVCSLSRAQHYNASFKLRKTKLSIDFLTLIKIVSFFCRSQ